MDRSLGLKVNQCSLNVLDNQLDNRLCLTYKLQIFFYFFHVITNSKAWMFAAGLGLVLQVLFQCILLT